VSKVDRAAESLGPELCGFVDVGHIAVDQQRT
jgi:hypothetical protein